MADQKGEVPVNTYTGGINVMSPPTPYIQLSSYNEGDFIPSNLIVDFGEPVADSRSGTDTALDILLQLTSLLAKLNFTFTSHRNKLGTRSIEQSPTPP